MSIVVAAILWARGFEALTARSAGRLGRSDVEQSSFAVERGRALLTHNRVHFERLHREWLEAGRAHPGIVVARQRAAREVAARACRLLTRLTAGEMKSQILYV